jgi:glycosyltransferase involved in cell wall biosynthesis
MKVLHVHEIAYIPRFLVEELRKKGVEAEFAEEVDAATIKGFDIVHGHYALNKKTIKAFRLARKLDVPFVLHYHGSDVRLLTGTGRRPLPFHYDIISRHMRKRSVKVFLSTPDLIGFAPEGEYVPNPVNLCVFKPMPEVEKTNRILICGKQVRGSMLPDLIKPDKEYDCVNTGYAFDFPGNVRELPYVERDRFPAFLNRYEAMIGTIGDVISMARLEAMACGLRTFTAFEKEFARFYDGLNPDTVEYPRAFVERFHNPDIAVSKLIAAYEAAARSR